MPSFNLGREEVKMTYKESIKSFEGINLLDVGYEVKINPEDLSQEEKRKLSGLGYDIDEIDWVWLTDVEKLGISHAITSYVSMSRDDDEIVYALERLLKKAPYYLVMAHNCTWNGSSGFVMVSKIEDTIKRDYNVQLYSKTVSRGGKCLVLSEHSHDVPTGAKTSIIALTEKEYHRLLDMDFYGIAKFAEKCENAA